MNDKEHIVELKAALRLIWHLHVRKEMHLGLETYSGLEQHCIPCICALALGESVDGGANQGDFKMELDKLCQPENIDSTNDQQRQT